MTSRRIVITSIMCAAAVAALTGAGNAIAASAGSRTGQPAILAPRDASLVTGSTVLVRARASTGFTALVAITTWPLGSVWCEAGSGRRGCASARISNSV